MRDTFLFCLGAVGVIAVFLVVFQLGREYGRREEIWKRVVKT